MYNHYFSQQIKNKIYDINDNCTNSYFNISELRVNGIN